MAKPLPVVRRSLQESWRGLIGWSAGIIATLVLYLPLHPSIAGPDLQALVDSLPDALIQALGYDQIATGAGYTQASFLGLIGFVLLAIAAISWGSGLGGGHEESGRLELDLAHRISRIGYGVEALLTLTVKLLVLSGVTWLTIWLLNGPSELNLQADNLAWAVLSLFALSLAIGAVSLAGGMAAGKKSAGVQAGAAVTIAAYVTNAVAALVPDADWLLLISPYAWAFGGEPLTTGPDGFGLSLLGALTAVGAAVSLVAIRRRDILG